MVIFTKLFCAVFGSVAGGFVFPRLFGNATSSGSYVAYLVAFGLLVGGGIGLAAGREILKEDPKPK